MRFAQCAFLLWSDRCKYGDLMGVAQGGAHRRLPGADLRADASCRTIAAIRNKHG